MEHFQTRNLQIVSAIENGATLQSIADEYGITRERVRQIGIKHGVKSSRRLTPEELNSITQQYEAGLRIAHIETPRSRHAVTQHLCRLGLHECAPQAPEWTKEQTRILKKMWGKTTCAVIAEAIGTTRNAVIGRAHRLGLPKLVMRPTYA